MYYNGFPEATAAASTQIGVSVVLFVVVVLLLSLAGIGLSVFMGLFVYNDAKARGVEMALLFGLLTGFLGLIPWIVYLAMRKSMSRPQFACAACGQAVPNGLQMCPACGSAQMLPLGVVDTAAYAKRARLFRNLGIAFACATGVLTILCVVTSFGMAFSIASLGY